MARPHFALKGSMMSANVSRKDREARIATNGRTDRLTKSPEAGEQ